VLLALAEIEDADPETRRRERRAKYRAMGVLTTG
jgi:hypothetical protein